MLLNEVLLEAYHARYLSICDLVLRIFLHDYLDFAVDIALLVELGLTSHHLEESFGSQCILRVWRTHQIILLVDC